jgi:hypothetical protein
MGALNGSHGRIAADLTNGCSNGRTVADLTNGCSNGRRALFLPWLGGEWRAACRPTNWRDRSDHLWSRPCHDRLRSGGDYLTPGVSGSGDFANSIDVVTP